MNHHHRRRPVGQRIADHLAALTVAALLYPCVRYSVRRDRKAGTR